MKRFWRDVELIWAGLASKEPPGSSEPSESVNQSQRRTISFEDGHDGLPSLCTLFDAAVVALSHCDGAEPFG